MNAWLPEPANTVVFFFMEIASVIICLWPTRIVTVRMPLSRSIIPWMRVSIGLVQLTEQVFKPEVDVFTSWVKRTVDQAVTHAICASVWHHVTRQVHSFYGTHSSVALLRDTWCWKYNKQEHQAYHFSWRSPKHLAKTTEKHIQRMMRNITFWLYLLCGMSSIGNVADKLPNLQIKLWLSDQSRLTLTPTHPNGTWAGPSPGPKSCWCKSLRRLSFLVPFFALMVLLRLLRFLKFPSSAQRKNNIQNEHARASYPGPSFLLPPGSN